MSKAHNYCFTLFHDDKMNKYNIEGLERLSKYKHITYIIAGMEKCPETQAYHLQGYLELSNAYAYKTIQKDTDVKCWFGKRKGQQDEAIMYCKGYQGKNKDKSWKLKDEVWGPNRIFELGEPSEQGKRTDLEIMHESIERGDSIQDISKTHFATFIRYARNIERYMELNIKIERKWQTELHIRWGVPNSGKSCGVTTEFPDHYPFPRPLNNNIYYAGYIGQEVILIDDFTGWLPFTELLTLCDKYPKKVNTCGKFTDMMAKKVFITSNYSWEEWYNWDNNCKGALQRRITSCTYFDKPWNDDTIRTIPTYDEFLKSQKPVYTGTLRNF